MEGKCMSYMKYLKNTQTNRFLKQALLCLQLCSIVIVLCGCEGYQIFPLELKGTLYLSDEQSIKEIYYALRNVYYEKLEEYILTDIRASYSSAYGEEPNFESVEFLFYKYIDDSNEGGNVSVITLGYDMLENKICKAEEYRGAGRAAPPGGAYWVPEEVLENFNEKIQTEELKDKNIEKLVSKQVKITGARLGGTSSIVTSDNLVIVYKITENKTY